MQTILGANGVIAKELAKVLPAYTENIRLVSRDPQKVNGTHQLIKAEITSAEQTLKAVEGSDVVYLTIGLKYDKKVWKHDWPVIMRNVINACKLNKSKLVFFDNVYALGKVNGWMTEESPMNTSSGKGEVRKELDRMILDEIGTGNLTALIARSADFYGPGDPQSFVTYLVFDRLRTGKQAQWLVNATAKHSLTFTADAGKATAMLGNTPSAYNQIWNLPTDKDALSGKEFIKLCEDELATNKGYSVLSRGKIKIGGLFSSVIRESVEMLYQYESDYLFDSTKFEKTFNFTPTAYKAGVAEIVRSLKKYSGIRN